MSGRGGWVCKCRWCQGSARVEAGMSDAREHWNAQNTYGYGPSANCGHAVWVACGISSSVHSVYISMFAQRFYTDSSVSLCQGSGL